MLFNFLRRQKNKGFTLALLLVTQFISVNSNAQNQTTFAKSYITILDNIDVYGVDVNGRMDKSLHFKVYKGTKFNVNGYDEYNNVKITFWNFRKGDSSEKITPNEFYSYQKDKGLDDEINLFVAEWANSKDFIMELRTFNDGAKLYEQADWDFNYGATSIPLKIRFGNGSDRYFDFEESVNLGFNFGLRRQFKSVREQGLSFLAGVNVSRVKMTADSLNNPQNNLVGSTEAAFGVNLGIVYQFEKFQVGTFVGTDYVLGPLGRDWKYQGSPWVGFGIGYSFFGKNNNIPASKQYQ